MGGGVDGSGGGGGGGGDELNYDDGQQNQTTPMRGTNGRSTHTDDSNTAGYRPNLSTDMGNGALVSPPKQSRRATLSMEVRETLPTELEPDADYPEAVPEAADGDSPTKQSKGTSLRRGRTAQLQRPDMHCGDLWLSVVTVLAALIECLTDAALLYEYNGFGDEARNNFWALIALRGLNAFFHIVFDYVNRGRIRYFLFDLCQLRVVIEWVHYVSDWCTHRNVVWIESEFRSDVTFESFMYSLPSLIVQVHWMITDETRDVSPIQIIGVFATSIQATINLLHVFKYV